MYIKTHNAPGPYSLKQSHSRDVVINAAMGPLIGRRRPAPLRCELNLLTGKKDNTSQATPQDASLAKHPGIQHS